MDQLIEEAFFRSVKYHGVDKISPAHLQKNGRYVIVHQIRPFKTSFTLSYIPSLEEPQGNLYPKNGL